MSHAKSVQCEYTYLTGEGLRYQKEHNLLLEII